MPYLLTNKDFIKKLQNIVDNYKTVYMLGTFGAPVSENLIVGKTKQLPDFYTAEKQKFLRSLIGKGYFAFDCVGAIKGTLWGWSGNASATYGGASYGSNNVPDTSADGMIKLCRDVSANFQGILPGEAVWLPGHIGVYIGGGKVIECTPKWDNKVQVSACQNIGTIPSMNNRLWQKHGKLPWIEYVTETAKPTSQEIVDFAAGKILADKAKWLKRVITDPEIRALLENFKKYCEKGGK